MEATTTTKTEVSTLPGVNVKEAIKDIEVLSRFKAKFVINPKTNCWEWIAGKNSQGYGVFWYENRMAPAYQISYRIYRGEYPEPLHVLHDCQTRSCVNPHHLRIGTHADNMRDLAEQGNNSLCKIDLKEAKTMRKQGYTYQAIGDKFGASKNAAYQILKRVETYEK